MYRATTSFTAKDYRVRYRQILADDFTTQDEIDELLEVGYIEVYDGTLEITENGIYNTKDYDVADVNVAGGSAELQEKSISITSNGSSVVLPDQNYDGMSKVTVGVNVPIPTPSLQEKTVSITSNGSSIVLPDQNYDGISKVNIDVNVSGGGSSIDWTEIGYEDTPQGIISGFNYAKEIQENWNSSITSMSSMYYDNKTLSIFPLVDTSNVTNMGTAFYGCSSLISLPKLNTSNVTNFNNAFSYCLSLYELPEIDTSKATDMKYMCANNTNLTIVPIFSMDALNTSMGHQNMFSLCPNLSDISLDNIMVSCYTSPRISNLTLKYMGLTQAQAQRCMTLPHYQDFINAGWSTGY